jgi:hypothetical protein
MPMPNELVALSVGFAVVYVLLYSRIDRGD